MSTSIPEIAVEGADGRSVRDKRDRSIDLAVSATLSIFGVIIIVGSTQIGLGSLNQPGSGFFPFLTGIALLLTAVASGTTSGAPATSAEDKDESSSPDTPDKNGPKTLAAIMAVALLIPLLAETTGFITITTIALIAMAKILKVRGWVRPIAVGLLSGVALWFVFVSWLLVPLPPGIFGMG